MRHISTIDKAYFREIDASKEEVVAFPSWLLQKPVPLVEGDVLVLHEVHAAMSTGWALEATVAKMEDQTLSLKDLSDVWYLNSKEQL